MRRLARCPECGTHGWLVTSPTLGACCKSCVVKDAHKRGLLPPPPRHWEVVR